MKGLKHILLLSLMTSTVDYNYTHIVIVADKSGSMSCMEDTPRLKLNEFIKEQQAQPVQQQAQPSKVTFDCWAFNDHCDLLFENKAGAEAVIDRDALMPAGGTALYSSLGHIIDTTGEKLAQVPEGERPGRVIMVIYTDGEENSSKAEYGGEAGRLLLKGKIEHQQTVYNWVFMFLGSNIDAVQNGTSIGITRQTCLNYNSSENGYHAVFRSASQAVDRFRTSEPTEDREEVLKRVAFTETDHETNQMPSIQSNACMERMPSNLRMAANSRMGSTDIY